MYSAMLGSGNDADLVDRTVGKIVKELSIIYIYIYDVPFTRDGARLSTKGGKSLKEKNPEIPN